MKKGAKKGLKTQKMAHKVNHFLLEVRRVELLSKITSMHVPTSIPFEFKVSSYPRPRRSARSLTSLENLGRRPQA